MPTTAVGEHQRADVGPRAAVDDRLAGGTRPGGLFGSNVTMSQILNDKWAYRVSAGYFTSQAYPRPTGTIPLIADPRAPGRAAALRRFGNADRCGAAGRA